MDEKWIVGFYFVGWAQPYWLMKSGDYWDVTRDQDEATMFSSAKELQDAVAEYRPEKNEPKYRGYQAIKLS